MLWHPLFTFTDGEAVAVAPAAQPSGGWESIAEVFRMREQSLREARNRRQRRDAEADIKREAEAVIAKVAKQSREQDLAALRRAVDSETLAFGDFYRQLLDNALAAIRAAELDRMALEAARIEAERLAALRAEDDALILLLVATL